MIKHGRHILFEKFTRRAKVCGLSFLDCPFRMLTGWVGKLRSRGLFSPTFFWHLTCFWLWLLAVFIFYFDTLFLVMEFVCLVEEMQFMLISRCRAHFTRNHDNITRFNGNTGTFKQQQQQQDKQKTFPYLFCLFVLLLLLLLLLCFCTCQLPFLEPEVVQRAVRHSLQLNSDADITPQIKFFRDYFLSTGSHIFL